MTGSTMEETEYQKKELKWDGVYTVVTAKGYGESYEGQPER